MRHTRQSAWLTAIFAGVVVAMLAPSAKGAAPASAGEVAINDAMEFRETFGLRADAQFVKEAAEDPNFSDVAWGVPLNKSELADLERRVEVREAIGPAVGYLLQQPDEAGFYTDQLDGGIPVFLFAGNIESHRAALATLLPDWVTYRVRQVDRSRSELNQIKNAVVDDATRLAVAGAELVSAGPHIATNTVDVGVSGDVERARHLLEKYGDAVVVREDRPAVLDTCDDIENCPRAKAGIAIQPHGSLSVCTAGWLGRRWDDSAPHDLVMVTAGHCIKWDTDWGNDTSWHLLDGTCVGGASSKYAPDPWVDGQNADVGFIAIKNDSCIPDVKNRLLLNSYDGTLVAITDERVADPHGNPNIHDIQAEGDPVCRVGWGSFHLSALTARCGTIFKTDQLKETCRPDGTHCVDVNNMQMTSFDSHPGDSGGTVFGPNKDVGNKKLMGSHSHSDDDDQPPPAASQGARRGWYSSQDWQMWVLQHHSDGNGGTWGVVVTPCFDANC